jgi:hypothetical protein
MENMLEQIMEGKINFQQEVINVTVANGQSIGTGRLRLPSGKCVGVAVAKRGNDHTDFVDFAVKDNGREIVKAADYSFSEKTNAGKWLDSVRPMAFDCNRVVDVEFTTPTVMAADIKFQVLFFIIQ